MLTIMMYYYRVSEKSDVRLRQKGRKIRPRIERFPNIVHLVYVFKSISPFQGGDEKFCGIISSPTSRRRRYVNANFSSMSCVERSHPASDYFSKAWKMS